MNFTMVLIIVAGFCLLGFLGSTFMLMFLAKKTHALLEFRAIMGKYPIGMFFRKDNQVEWKIVKPDAGMIKDKEYGAFILNETGNYVDRSTKNIILPFDTDFGQNISMETFNAADQFKKVFKDPEKLKRLREKIILGALKTTRLDFIKQSVDLRGLKHLMNIQTPQIIDGVVEKRVMEQRQLDKPNPWTVILPLIAGLGGAALAIVIFKVVG